MEKAREFETKRRFRYKWRTFRLHVPKGNYGSSVSHNKTYIGTASHTAGVFATFIDLEKAITECQERRF